MNTDLSTQPTSLRETLRRYAKAGLLLFISCAVAVLLAEIALRIARIEFPRYVVFDQYTGDSLRAGLEFWSREEDVAFVSINSRGLRDREHQSEKPPNVRRVAILGDSVTAAFQVPIERTFWSVLEREMNQCVGAGGPTFEVINFGVSGYGTARELLTLRHRVWEYSPDIVLLAFVTGNDVSNNSPALDPNSFRKPYFVYRNGRLELDDSFRHSEFFRSHQTASADLYYRFYNLSRVMQVLNQARIVFALMGTDSRVAGPPGTENGLNNEVYSEPRNQTWQEAWRVTEELIVQMRDEVVSKGAQFLVVTLSNGIQVHPDPEVRQTFMKGLGVDNLFYADFRIEKLGFQKAISTLILAPQLQQYAERQKIALHGVGAHKGYRHWNAQGHEVAGKLMAQRLCAQFGAGE